MRDSRFLRGWPPPFLQSPIAGTGGPPGNTEFSLPDGSTVKRDGGGNIPDELVGELSNEVGTISMANTGAPNSGGSQFFLNTKHNAFLDYFDNSTPSKHPVFGKVVEGEDIVFAIEKTPTGPGVRCLRSNSPCSQS